MILDVPGNLPQARYFFAKIVGPVELDGHIATSNSNESRGARVDDDAYRQKEHGDRGKNNNQGIQETGPLGRDGITVLACRQNCTKIAAWQTTGVVTI